MSKPQVGAYLCPAHSETKILGVGLVIFSYEVSLDPLGNPPDIRAKVKIRQSDIPFYREYDLFFNGPTVSFVTYGLAFTVWVEAFNSNVLVRLQ